MREELELARAKVELETSKVELEKLKQQHASQKVRGVIGAASGVTSLLVALCALFTSWCGNVKTERAYTATTEAVYHLNENQQKQKEKVDNLRDYAVSLASSPVQLSAPPSSSAAAVPVVRTSVPKPPSPMEELIHIDMPAF